MGFFVESFGNERRWSDGSRQCGYLDPVAYRLSAVRTWFSQLDAVATQEKRNDSNNQHFLHLVHTKQAEREGGRFDGAAGVVGVEVVAAVVGGEELGGAGRVAQDLIEVYDGVKF